MCMIKNKVAIYTSINAVYLDKAVNLGRSILRLHDDVDFYIVMAESEEAYNYKDVRGILGSEGIKIISIQNLDIERFSEYVFQRTVVELCTAVKGRALNYFMDKMNYGKVIYLDPDIHVFAPLSRILDQLNKNEVILIPHQPRPAEIQFGVDAEITSLQYGVYNLGFVAVSNVGAGRDFSKWWAKRLDKYCFDDRKRGLFTDQKWCDLAPALFDNIYVLRDLGFNSAPWNAHCGQMRFEYGTGQIFIDNFPLIFFHFSSFDSGAGLRSCQQMGSLGLVQSELYMGYNSNLKPIRDKYKNHISTWTYGCYSDGAIIDDKDRLVVKNLFEQGIKIGDPFSISGKHFIKTALANMSKRIRPN